MPIQDKILSNREFFSTGEIDTCYSKTPIAIYRCDQEVKFTKKYNLDRHSFICYKTFLYELKFRFSTDQTEIVWVNILLAENNNIY